MLTIEELREYEQSSDDSMIVVYREQFAALVGVAEVAQTIKGWCDEDPDYRVSVADLLHVLDPALARFDKTK
jgi:hypothetical protein